MLVHDREYVRISFHPQTNSVIMRMPAGSQAIFKLMHLESDVAVHASCLSTTKPLLRCLQPPSVWECHDFNQV
jgi:hypothetical protein